MLKHILKKAFSDDINRHKRWYIAIAKAIAP